MSEEPADTGADAAAEGTVYLVGSGPGDPELLTVKARRLLGEADTILHDKLPGPDILEEIPDGKREDVGKRAHGEGTSQAYINERLVELARAGETVVRLKGGDPTVFGRGGEEMAYLAERGVHFEVVPAVTSAVTFVTGHENPDKEDSAVDWEALAATGGTIVVLMGVTRLPEYTTALAEAGMPPSTPVALVERATWDGQRVATGTLETIVETRDTAGIEPPALTVIGDVAATRERVVDFLATTEADP